MPLQNRVLPTQEIVADPGRGLLMGNRGCLHGPDRRLGTTRWRSKAWISCVLDFRGRRRDPMPPGRWTALFFLDEAVALAAGHRPCHYCRRRDFLLYAGAWAPADVPRPLAAEMDAVLHSQRVDVRTRRQRTTIQPLSELPDGAMVRFDGAPALVLDGRILPWSWDGYAAPATPRGLHEIETLTPPANLAVLQGGYTPLLHPSARAQLRAP
ncbi:hypothetical protein [Kribbella sp. NPDC048915]|uniref:hypothetical protein n=1 Tax=Kribbella sp. NPDC048915 TaxID=3155148 RepID=UPI0033EEF30B